MATFGYIDHISLLRKFCKEIKLGSELKFAVLNLWVSSIKCVYPEHIINDSIRNCPKIFQNSPKEYNDFRV